MVTSEKISDLTWLVIGKIIGKKMMAIPYSDSSGISIGEVSREKSFLFLDFPRNDWGDPVTKDTQGGLEDVLEGYVSLEVAGRDYGVVIDQ
jgi:hypothetical protein